MVIIGIDPGTTAIGFAAIESERPPRLLEAGLFPIAAAGQSGRLAELHRAMTDLIARVGPSAIAVEKLFFSKNVKTAMTVAEARGVILLTAALACINVYEYAPGEIKKTVAGHGGADKKAIEKMITLTLPETRALDARDDVFDAIAISLTCHFLEFSRTSRSNIG